MKVYRNNFKDILKLIVYVLLLIPIYGYLTFYFVYPPVGIIPLAPYGWMGWLFILYSVAVGIVERILLEEPQEAFMVIFISSILGYALGLIYQSFPAYIYGYAIYANSWKYFDFIAISWILLVFYIIFGMIGVFIGGFLREKIE